MRDLEVEWRLPNERSAHARVKTVAMQSEHPQKPPRQYPRATSALRDVLHLDERGAGSRQLDAAGVVSGPWLVKAILISLAVAGAAVYFAICLLFYQGQWQFVFAPPNLAHTRAVNDDWLAGSWARRRGPAPATHYTPPSAAAAAQRTGLPIADVGFDYTQAGVKQLDGWWIPASTDSGSTTLSSMVVLFCSNGHTDLSENVSAFQALHALGVSVFAFDYRGFGASQPEHPSQQKAYKDGAAALRYLTTVRHIAPSRIAIYGAELGSAVAAQVAVQSPQIAGLVLEDPQPSLLHQVKREQRLHVLPMWLIFTQRFDIARIVPQLQMPKLIVATPTRLEYESGTAAIYREAVPPKEIVHVQPTNAPSLYDEPEWRQAVGKFLVGLTTGAPAGSR